MRFFLATRTLSFLNFSVYLLSRVALKSISSIFCVGKWIDIQCKYTYPVSTTSAYGLSNCSDYTDHRTPQTYHPHKCPSKDLAQLA